MVVQARMPLIRLSAHLPLNILELPTACRISRCRPWASPRDGEPSVAGGSGFWGRPPPPPPPPSTRDVGRPPTGRSPARPAGGDRRGPPGTKAGSRPPPPPPPPAT